MKPDDLIELIKNDRTCLVDRVGDTPLIRLATQIKHAPSSAYNHIEMIKILPEVCIQILNSFSVFNLRALLGFLFDSVFSKEELSTVFEIFKKHLSATSTKFSEEEISCRGMAMRFLSENGEYSASELEKETTVREKAPWLYADCAVHLTQRNIIPFVAELLKNDQYNGVIALMDRLPYWRKILTKTEKSEATKKWMEVVSDLNREKLQRWITNFKFNLAQ